MTRLFVLNANPILFGVSEVAYFNSSKGGGGGGGGNTLIITPQPYSKYQ